MQTEDVKIIQLSRAGAEETPHAEARDTTIHELFEDEARRTPEAIAVEYEGERLTYRELNRRANQLARYLRRRHVGPDVLVGICVEPSLEMVVSLLGVLKAGGAYVPLDPTHPRERLSCVIEDAHVEFLLTDGRSDESGGATGREGVSGTRPREIHLVEDWPTIGRERDEDLEGEVTARDVAYVIYTSGSTGRPKGVQIEHRSVVNLLLSMRREPGMSATETLLAVTTLSFDIAVLELFLPLITGARCVLVRRDVASDGTALLKRLKESGATVIQATPATYRMILDAGWKEPLPVRILCGGEALPRDLADQLLPRSAEVWNLYGPTETTIWSSVARVVAGEGRVSIGRPIANTRFYVLDRRRQRVPAGVAGELYIGGDGLARGYLNRPELTAERFVPNPFSRHDGARLYRTGDLVRRRTDGALEFLGRLDHQVKVRGFRIELGEIEAVARQHAAVRDAVVVACEDRPGDQRLVGYYVSEGDVPLRRTELRDHLAAKLPDYMVPSHLVPLDELPLTPNLKVDRNALPEVDFARMHVEGGHVERRDALESALVSLWKQVLGVKRVAVLDNFFELGGHSLLAAQLFARIGKLLGRELPPAVLFQAPTVKELAELLRDASWQPNWSSLVAIRPTGRKPPLYLIHAAEGTVLLYRKLAHRLPADQPVFGLQSAGLDGSSPLETRIEDMAAHYVREIRAFQPSGPYYLGGYCLGGAIALEVAQRLRAEGAPVALVAMLETYNIKAGSRRRPFLQRPYQFLQNVKFHIDNVMAIPDEDKVKFLREKQAVARARLRLRVARTWHRLSRPFGSRRANGGLHLWIKELTDRAHREYHPNEYFGRVVLFRPRTYFRGYDDPQFGWGDVVKGQLDVQELPWSPKGMLVEPFVETLAERLAEAIERVPALLSTPSRR